MELLIEDIEYCEKRLREIQCDLNWNKSWKAIYLLAIIILIITSMVLLGMLLNDLSILTVHEFVFRSMLIATCGVIIWILGPCLLHELNIETLVLKKTKFQYERDIEKYKNDMIDLREMEKRKTYLSLTKLTEKQTDELNYYTEKAKQFFKWLIVTKDGEVVASDIKPEYNEECETWLFDNVANTIQIGHNKKLAKKSKHTLTKIISGGYTSLGI